MTRVVAFVPDLMDRSKVQGAARAKGARLELVASPSELGTALDDDVSLVLVDLSRPGVLEALSACRGAPIVGFGSHVDAELLEAAKRAGCREALPRSAFFKRLPGLVGAATTGDEGNG